ncbi:MAG: amidohydrolase family protein [Clostridiales bacterium]
MIDCHLHLSDIKSFAGNIKENGVDFTPTGYAKECLKNNVYGIALGMAETDNGEMPDKLCEPLMGINFCKYPHADYAMGINPHTFNQTAAEKLESKIKTDKHLVGIKIYGGYYHFYLTDPIYAPIFELTTKYNLPITFHSGDTFSNKALLKYAHPLIADEIAQRYPNVKLILAHMGNPWIIDAAEVAHKNPNVYVDISGLYIGENLKIAAQDQQIIDFHTLALKLIHNYHKVLYGSDWPLTPMAPYIDFIKRIVPEKEWEKVFYRNALNVFTRLNCK